MTLPVFIRQAAELDLAEAEDRYEEQRQGLGTEFRAQVDDLLAALSTHPQLFPVRYRGNRRAVLRRFPYLLWYRVEADAVILLACIHAKRHPRVARARLRLG